VTSHANCLKYVLNLFVKSRIIRIAVFGVDEGRKPRDELRFATNNLVVTSIDIR
jgi:hypothetical protein